MSPAPKLTPEEAFAKLQLWYQQQAQLAELKTAEVLARKELAAFYFTEPVEGSQNRMPLGDGFDLKLTHGINRNVDEAALANVTAAAVKKHKLNLDELFPMKPTLSLSAYRDLTEAQRVFVDSLLDIAPGTPKLEIVPSTTAGEVPVIEQDFVPAYTIVTDPGEATEGDYYGDDGSWWQLVVTDETAAWAPVEDADLIAALTQQVALDATAAELAAAPKKRRARRKAGGAE
jgi:hypothetical protein